MSETDAPVELLVDNRNRRIAAFIERIGPETAVVAATSWATDDDPRARRLAFAVLGLAALDDASALQALLTCANVSLNDGDPEVREALADALGDQSMVREANQLLLRMANDGDEHVRARLAAGLVITMPDDESLDHPAIVTLMRMLGDDSPLVRDWAAFALGTNTDVDSDALRDAFLHMAEHDVETEDIYPAAEAALGLARRGDRRVTEVIQRRLGEHFVGRLWLEAAAELADPELYPALSALRARRGSDAYDSWDNWDDAMTLALANCDPAASR